MDNKALEVRCLLYAIVVCLLTPGHVDSRNTTKGSRKPDDRPNILLILADDMTWRDSAPYGNPDVQTPNLSRLAEQGMTFHGMYTATAMCAPTRQQLYTGMYPVRNGAYPNHSQVYEGIKSLPHHLGKLGYRVGLTGKSHFGPPSSFPFQNVGNSGNINRKNLNAIEDFIRKDSDEPFALVVASHQPHRPWNKGNQDEYDPNDISVPSYLVDTPTTRRQLASYYAEISYMDQQIGKLLELIKEADQKENTLVIFSSEQGSFFPFAKWTCYENGLKTAFIARWPRKIAPDTKNYALVQYVDIVPTLLEVAGGDPETVRTGRPDANGEIGFDGRSFLPLLLGNKQHFRDYVYGIHTTLGIIGAEKPYPIRSVSNGKYKLIRNMNSEAEFSNITKTERGNELINAWRKAGQNNPNIFYRAWNYYNRPPIELYDLKTDPNELHNLAGVQQYNDIVKQLNRELEKWMLQQGDVGMETERKANHRIND